MKTLEISGTSPRLDEVIDSLREEPLVLTREGQPLAVLLPVAGSDPETVSLSLNPQFLALLEASARRHHTEGGISLEEMRRRLGVERPSTNAAGGGKKVRGKRP